MSWRPFGADAPTCADKMDAEEPGAGEGEGR
jgi:hypothetical protein